MANQDFPTIAAGLQDALTVLEEGHTDEAVSRVTRIKHEAAKVAKELEEVQQALGQLKMFYSHQGEFLVHHIKILEKRERELVISKSISESIQRSQHKKLQACKWDLMKARNALYLSQKKLNRQERELMVNGFHNILPLWEQDNESVNELRAIVCKIELVVNKLEKDCNRQENTSLDILRKIAELKNKREIVSEETKCLRVLQSTRVHYIQQIQEVEVFTKQAASLWTLCNKAFDNGRKREDVLNAIARQAKETVTFPHDSESIQDNVLHSCSRMEGGTTIQGVINLLQFSPQCLLCGQLIKPSTCFECEHCSIRKPQEVLISQKVVVNSFTCTSEGTIHGTVLVANIAYDKHVYIRYSQNKWLSSDEIVARYESSTGDCDHFQFELPFNLSASMSLEFAVRYQVVGAEFWDNNAGRNYRIIF